MSLSFCYIYKDFVRQLKAFRPSFCHFCACEMSPGWGDLITWIDPSVGHLNGILARVGGNLNNNFQKSQMPGGLPGGGHVEASIWPIHYVTIYNHEIYIVQKTVYEDPACRQLWIFHKLKQPVMYFSNSYISDMTTLIFCQVQASLTRSRFCHSTLPHKNFLFLLGEGDWAQAPASSSEFSYEMRTRPCHDWNEAQ